MVEQVRQAHERRQVAYEQIFDQLASIATEGTEAFQKANLDILGDLMNIAHGCLNSMQLSTPALEELVFLARRNGALGAKLTGGGGGGSVVALCPETQTEVSTAMETAGYQTYSFTVE